MAKKFILLVEDNPDDEALMLRVLKKHGVADKVVVVRDGAEALDFLYGTGVYAGRDPRLLPVAVLLDIKMPQVGGLEVLERIRREEHTRYLPVVMLTSSAEDKDIVASYRLGANSYVCKPIQFDEFAEATWQIVHYWLSLNIPPPVKEV